MQLRLEATENELAEKGLSLVRELATSLVRHDARLAVIAGAIWKSELATRRTVSFAGLEIVIENPPGSIREWHDEDTGRSGKTEMKYAYGYVKRTIGADGDGYDCFLGPNPSAPFVWIVHQARPDSGELYDEDKALLGFDGAHDAAEAYLAHYDDPRFLGSMSQMTVEEFRAKVLGTGAGGQDGMLKARPRRPKAKKKKKNDELMLFVPADVKSPSVLEKTLAPVLAGVAAIRDRAVVSGTSGPNIAFDVPARPTASEPSIIPVTHDLEAQAANSPGALRTALAEAQAEHAGAEPIKRDREIYRLTELDELPLHPLAEWIERQQIGEEARADRAGNLDWVQQRLDRRHDALRAHPERLVPRDPRPTFVIDDASNGIGARVAAGHAGTVGAKLETPRELGDEVEKTVTVERAGLGPVTLEIRKSGFVVRVHERNAVALFPRLTDACDWVWVLQKGYPSVEAYRRQTGTRKVPSGGGWKFWGIKPEPRARRKRHDIRGS